MLSSPMDSNFHSDKKRKRKREESEQLEPEEADTSIKKSKKKKLKQQLEEELGLNESDYDHENGEEVSQVNGNNTKHQEEPNFAEDESEETETESNKAKKKKKRKHKEPSVEKQEEPTLDESEVEPDPSPLKKQRKKRKTKRIDGNEDVSDIEKRYITAVRVKVDDKDDIHRLLGSKANIDNKVIDLPEAEYNPKDVFNMPPLGILNEGVPFHHCHPYPLKEQHFQRLKVHGISIKKGPFSRGEDEQIIENWRKYAKKFDLDYDDAPLYCGWAKNLNIELPQSVKRFHLKTRFLPYMCAGLINRSALQVYRRCYRIFDPNLEEFGQTKEREWTEADDEHLKRLYEIEGPSWQKIAVQMKRNRFQCQLRYTRVLCGEKPPQYSQKTKNAVMWVRSEDSLRLIYDHAKDYLPGHPVELVIQGVGEEEDNNIDWHPLCRKYQSLTPEICHAQWVKVKARLRSAYERANDPNITFTEVEKAVLSKRPKKCRNFKPQIAHEAYKIMRDLAEEKDATEIYDIDPLELTRRLKDADISFYSARSMGSHVIKIAHKILTVLKMNLYLDIFSPTITLPELLDFLAYFMKKSIRKLHFTKLQCFEIIHRYLRHKKWEPNPRYKIVDREELAVREAIRAEESSGDEGNNVNGADHGNDESDDNDENGANDNEKGNKAGNVTKSDSDEDSDSSSENEDKAGDVDENGDNAINGENQDEKVDDSDSDSDSDED